MIASIGFALWRVFRDVLATLSRGVGWEAHW